MVNVAIGVLCAFTGWWMCALALRNDSSVPRWLFVVLAVLNLSLAVLNIVKGISGGVA